MYVFVLDLQRKYTKIFHVFSKNKQKKIANASGTNMIPVHINLVK